MASAVRVPFLSVEEYLHASFEPDADYVDGVLEERNLGEFDHGDLQWAVLEAINVFTRQYGIRARPEVRVQVASTRFRVPDVCVVSAKWKRTQIVREPPLLCVEVLSPRDRLQDMVARCQDFLRMGVAEVWTLDPRTRSCIALTADGNQVHVLGTRQVPGTPVSVEIANFFRVLDEQ